MGVGPALTALGPVCMHVAYAHLTDIQEHSLARCHLPLNSLQLVPAFVRASVRVKHACVHVCAHMCAGVSAHVCACERTGGTQNWTTPR